MDKATSNPNIKLTRRSLLIGAGGLGAIGGLAPLISADMTRTIKAYITRNIPDLKIDDDALTQFAQDFIADYRSTRSSADTLLAMAKYERAYFKSALRPLMPGAIRSRIERTEDQALRAFMMGTTYLDADRRVDEPVEYLYYPDPYQAGCANRLAVYGYGD